MYDRQPLILVPYQIDWQKPTTVRNVDSSNESNDGYFPYAKRIFSFINPFSYFGGDGSLTSSGQQSQNALWEYSEFLFPTVVSVCYIILPSLMSDL